MKGTPVTDTIEPYLGFLDEDDLRLPPIPSTKHPREEGGKVYTVPLPDALMGARLAGLGEIMVKQARGITITERDAKRLHLDDDEEVEFQVSVLGPVLDEMKADGVTWEAIKRATNYAFVAFAFNEDAAMAMAREGKLTGKAVPVETNRQERRASKSGNPATKAKAKPKAKPAQKK